jgi:serine/threonine protein kinase
VADLLGIHAADYLLTEAGFGADMGAERFFDVKCRVSGLRPDAAVVVVTVRALKTHSGRFRVVAGKPLPPEMLAESADDVRAGAANLRAHIEIVRRFGVQLDGPRPHLILENLDGPRLSTLVREHGALPVQQLLPLALELASALHYLRVRDVVHLDVKPSNVIMGAPARLIDLSIARRTEAAAALEDVVGTDDYLAPEQADPQGYGVPSPASDVWGLGATLYHAACGYAPYEPGREGHALEVRYPQLTNRPRPMPYFVEVEVAELVYRCMAPDPGDRPTPREVAQAVEPLMEAMPRARLSGFRISASA